MKPQALVLALLCAVAPAGLVAQDSLVHASIDSGTLVRMHPASGASVRGRLIQPLTPSSVFIQYCRYPARPCTNPTDTAAFGQVPVASIQRLEVQQGSKWATGAVYGGIFGAILGGAFGAAMNGLCDTSDCGSSVVVDAAVSGMFFAIIGGMIGNGSPKWVPAP